MILLLFAACGALAPSQDPTVDAERLAALPADVTVIGAFDAAAVRGSPLYAALDEARLDEGLAELGVGAADVDRIVLGCGDDGCAALAEGRFASAARVDASTTLGRVAGRRLDDRRLVVGDRSALRRMARDAADDAPGLDPAALAGRVPAGEAWILLRDPATLTDQAAARLERAPLWAEAGAGVREAWARHGAEAEGVSSIAVSLDVATSTLRARAVCDSEADARRLRLKLDAWRAASPGAGGDVVRDGAVLEWSRAVDEATIAAWAGGAS